MTTKTTQKKKVSALSIAKKLGAKKKDTRKNLITHEKERQKLERFGIKAIVDNAGDDGETFVVEVGADLAFIYPESATAKDVAKGLYEYVNAEAHKLAKRIAEE